MLDTFCYCSFYASFIGYVLQIFFFFLSSHLYLSRTRLPVIVIPTNFWMFSRTFALWIALLYFPVFSPSSMCVDVNTDKKWSLRYTFSCVCIWIFIPSHLRNLFDDGFTLLYTQFFYVSHFDCLKCLQVIIAQCE